MRMVFVLIRRMEIDASTSCLTCSSREIRLNHK